MADRNGATAVHDADSHMEEVAVEPKGKGKAVGSVQQEAGDEEEDSSDEETGAEEEEAPGNTVDDEEEDMAEIDMSNIIGGGRRTRGKTIDFAKAAENAGDELEDDEDDDEDFEEKVDEDAMQE
ncbi:MAG: Histone H2A.Z-specific chaperone [Thelocarpon impressellum]|nr:MAG: Histone H2A.Z-specific chaperone [Thelocarpon impressellum]